MNTNMNGFVRKVQLEYFIISAEFAGVNNYA